jgi:hypothetical protein
MRNYLLALMTLAATLVLAACGSDSGSSNNTYPYGCTTYVNGQCLGPNGQIITPQTQIRFGVTNCSDQQILQTGRCADAPGYFQVSNVSVYRDFLEKALGTCTNSNSGGWADCSNWWPGKFDIAITANTNVSPNQYCSAKGLTVPSTMSVYAKAGYVNYSAIQYGYSLNLGGSYSYNNGATFSNATVNVINDCKGFEIRQIYGRYLLQIIVKEGNLSTGQLNYQLAWGSNGTGNTPYVFATGTMYRY